MTLLLVLLVLLPWSIARQMRAHAITRAGLIKLPLLFAVIGIAGLGTRDLPTDAAALAYAAGSAALSIGFGVLRGAKLSIWRDAHGRPVSQGNRTTISLWGALLATKVGLGTVAAAAGWFPAEHAGEVFLFLAASFAAQNLVVASRTFTIRPWTSSTALGH